MKIIAERNRLFLAIFYSDDVMLSELLSQISKKIGRYDFTLDPFLCYGETLIANNLEDFYPESLKIQFIANKLTHKVFTVSFPAKINYLNKVKSLRKKLSAIEKNIFIEHGEIIYIQCGFVSSEKVTTFSKISYPFTLKISDQSFIKLEYFFDNEKLLPFSKVSAEFASKNFQIFFQDLRRLLMGD